MTLKVKFILFYFLLGAFSFSQVGYSQEIDSPPDEAPYVKEDDEFEESSAAEVTPSPSQDSTEEIAEDLIEEVNSNKEVVESQASEPEKSVQKSVPEFVQRTTKSGATKYIQHPLAAKGLIRIEKDGAYIYKTDLDHSFDKTGIVRFGAIDAPKIISKDGTTDFETMYQGATVPFFMFDYEWQPFTSFGRLGLQAGLGLMVSQGNGRFACSNCGAQNGTIANERYTFVAMPLSLGAVYRLAWWDHQWLAPYIAGGGTYIPALEFRDDNATPHGVGTPGFYASGGVLFNLSAVDRETAFILRKEYGVSNLWLLTEYRSLKTLTEDLDFSSNIFSMGIGVDY